MLWYFNVIDSAPLNQSFIIIVKPNLKVMQKKNIHKVVDEELNKSSSYCSSSNSKSSSSYSMKFVSLRKSIIAVLKNKK